jgi:hypothetical protein
VIGLDAFHLPDTISTETVVRSRIERAGVRVLVPDLSADDIVHICVRLHTAQARLRTLTTRTIIDAIDAAARLLLERAEPERVTVLASLQSITGYSAPMAVHVLDRMARDWLAPALHGLVTAEFGGAEPLDGFAITPAAESDRRRSVRAIAPPLGFHVFSGNVPGVNVTSMIRALLVRSAVLGKCAAGEPALAPAFARLLARVDPVIGSCIAVTYWPGGDTALEQAALDNVSLVVHYGGAEAIASLRARAPAHVRFVEHGPRISFAVVAGASLSESRACTRVAADLARAVALFDQQGCVSPQLVYVVGSAQQARSFAEAVAAAMPEVQQELPRGRIEASEAAAIREMRTRAEFAAIAGSGAELWGPDALLFSVILADDSVFEGTCLNRTLLVKRAPDIDTLLDAVRPFGTLLQTVGLAGFDDDERLSVASALAVLGATRVCAIADMPWPPPAWHHDGRGPLTELVRWSDHEE